MASPDPGSPQEARLESALPTSVPAEAAPGDLIPRDQALVAIRRAQVELAAEATRFFELAGLVFVALRPLLMHWAYQPDPYNEFEGLRFFMTAFEVLTSSLAATMVVILPVAGSLFWRSRRRRRFEAELLAGEPAAVPLGRLPVPSGRALLPFLPPGTWAKTRRLVLISSLWTYVLDLWIDGSSILTKLLDPSSTLVACFLLVTMFGITLILHGLFLGPFLLVPAVLAASQEEIPNRLSPGEGPSSPPVGRSTFG